MDFINAITLTDQSKQLKLVDSEGKEYIVEDIVESKVTFDTTVLIKEA